ncbi:hypothetical protein CYLTODRAFT_426047, partial [Cylindrobasidium torrendii FP15055 ss-10]
MIHIPYELVDLVLQEVGNDTRTLQASSLVCSTFAASSQARLFSKIVLTQGKLEQCNTVFPASSNVLNLVRQVGLYPDASFTKSLPQFGEEMKLLFSRLANVQSVEVVFLPVISWEKLAPQDTLRDALQHLSSLRTMRIMGIQGIPAAENILAMARCAHVELNVSTSIIGASGGTGISASFSHIRHLSLMAQGNANLLRALSATARVQLTGLQVLEVVVQTWQDVRYALSIVEQTKARALVLHWDATSLGFGRICSGKDSDSESLLYIGMDLASIEFRLYNCSGHFLFPFTNRAMLYGGFGLPNMKLLAIEWWRDFFVSLARRTPLEDVQEESLEITFEVRQGRSGWEILDDLFANRQGGLPIDRVKVSNENEVRRENVNQMLPRMHAKGMLQSSGN